MTTVEEKNRVGLAGFIIAAVSCIGCGVLSIVGFVVSLVGCFKKPRGFAVTGVVLSLVTAAGWTVIGVAVYRGVIGVATTLRMPLQAAIGFEANTAAQHLAETQPDGASGTVSNVKWSGPQDIKVPLAVDWDKVGDRYRVHVQPEGGVPSGQTGDMVTMWVLPGGDVAMSLEEMDACAHANRSSLIGGVLADMLLGLIQQVTPDIDAITAWSKDHENEAPPDEEGTKLLVTTPGKQTFDLGDGKTVDLTVKTIKYHTLASGEFALRISFTAKTNFTSQSSTRSFTFTPDGLMVDPFGVFENFGIVDMRGVFD